MKSCESRIELKMARKVFAKSKFQRARKQLRCHFIFHFHHYSREQTVIPTAEQDIGVCSVYSFYRDKQV
jgi:hypothetical protein